jgi:Zn-dependent peptidase ImmA (M78 family)
MEVCNQPVIEELNFSNRRIGGILCRNSSTTWVALNALHTGPQRNFFCGHEFIHYCIHEAADQMWVCSELSANTGNIAEWQANSGSAELLVPYRYIIPEFVDSLSVYRPHFHERHLNDIYEKMARKYNVSELVIKFRIEELVYETMQYICGKPLGKLEFLSRAAQVQRGIEQYSPLAVYARIHNTYDLSYRFLDGSGNWKSKTEPFKWAY